MSSQTANWQDQPGLFEKEEIQHIPSYNAQQDDRPGPSKPQKILPRYLPDMGLYEIMETEYILVGLDFKTLCKEKKDSDINGEYRYKPLTEAGLAMLDIRALRDHKTAPGDRGNELFQFIKTIHFTVKEFEGHWGHECSSAPWEKPSYSRFAFGTSLPISTEDLSNRLSQAMRSLSERNRTPHEEENQELRQLLFLVWDSRVKENTVSRLGLNWFLAPNVQLWDLQAAEPFGRRFGRHDLPIDYALEALGLRYIDQRHGNISHCAGNEAAFVLQLFIALNYIEPHLYREFLDWKRVPWLRYTWNGFMLDQVNTVPGEQAQRRPDSQKNDNDVPQIRNLEGRYYI